MHRTLLKSKIHRARVTGSKLHYSGSLAVDEDLMDAVNLKKYEHVLIADLDNGNRLETYVIPAERGSKEVTVLGAAAHLMNEGDIVIILNFAQYDEAEAADHKPSVIVCDEKNEIEKRIS